MESDGPDAENNDRGAGWWQSTCAPTEGSAMDDDDERLAAACARLAREKGWPGDERDRLRSLLADEGRRRALYGHPRRMEFVGRALAEMLGGDGAPGRTVTSEPDEVEVRVVAPMTAERLAPP